LQTEFFNVGYVTTMTDGIVRISGLSETRIGELVKIETYQQEYMQALVFDLEPEDFGAVIMGNQALVGTGCTVINGPLANIICGYSVLGRVIDSLGNPIDGYENFSEEESQICSYIERKAPGIIQRGSINEPVQTGIKYLDIMIPIGCGQRELIIGDRLTGKTTIAVDTILMQKESIRTVFCIYVAIGVRRVDTAILRHRLKKRNSLFYTTIVSATAADSAALQFLAPYSGCAIGEWFRDGGEQSLIFYDDIGRQAVAYRQIALLLRRPPGREAYPGDVFLFAFSIIRTRSSFK